MASTHDAFRLEYQAGSNARRRPATSRRDVFRLPAAGPCVAEARRRLRARLEEWAVEEDVRDDAGLILSELFTNAIRHSESRLVACAMRIVGSELRLEVADEGQTLTEPQARQAGVDEECGRGLLLVATLASQWGVHVCQDGRGRVVWAVLPRTRQPQPSPPAATTPEA